MRRPAMSEEAIGSMVDRLFPPERKRRRRRSRRAVAKPGDAELGQVQASADVQADPVEQLDQTPETEGVEPAKLESAAESVGQGMGLDSMSSEPEPEPEPEPEEPSASVDSPSPELDSDIAQSTSDAQLDPPEPDQPADEPGEEQALSVESEVSDEAHDPPGSEPSTSDATAEAVSEAGPTTSEPSDSVGDSESVEGGNEAVDAPAATESEPETEVEETPAAAVDSSPEQNSADQVSEVVVAESDSERASEPEPESESESEAEPEADPESEAGPEAVAEGSEESSASGGSQDESANSPDELESADAELGSSPDDSDANEEHDSSAGADGAAVTHEELDELMPEGLMETKFVDEIARITQAFESMRDQALAEIQTSARDGAARDTELGESLDRILGEFSSIRQEMLETGRVAKRSIEAAATTSQRMRSLHERLARVRGQADPSSSGVASLLDRPIFLIAALVILVGWAGTYYAKTGDLMMTLGGITLANLVGCSIFVYSRLGRLSAR